LSGGEGKGEARRNRNQRRQKGKGGEFGDVLGQEMGLTRETAKIQNNAFAAQTL